MNEYRQDAHATIGMNLRTILAQVRGLRRDHLREDYDTDKPSPEQRIADNIADQVLKLMNRMASRRDCTDASVYHGADPHSSNGTPSK